VIAGIVTVASESRWGYSDICWSRYGSWVSIGVREATIEDAAALRSFLTTQGLPTEDILAPGSVYWVAGTQTKEVIASAGLEFGSEAGLLRSVAIARLIEGRA